MISTCVEPNTVRNSKECSLYASLDSDRWQQVLVYRKDRYHPQLFQFGTIVLPYAYHDQPRGMYSGQAIEEMDGRLSFLSLL